MGARKTVKVTAKPKPASFDDIGGAIPAFGAGSMEKIQGQVKRTQASLPKPKPVMKPIKPKGKQMGLKSRRGLANRLAEKGLDGL